jgi:predicted anti-sigma-YlaC factor YlaD
MVDSWAQAAAPQQAVAFGVAESLRWVEIGINSLFRVLQGTTLVAVGLALVLSERVPRWLGWSGVILGLALVLRGIAVAFGGFDLSDPLYFATSVVTSLPVTLLNVWMVILAILLWRSSLFHDSTR